MCGQEFAELCSCTNHQLALEARYLGQVIPCSLQACKSSDRSSLCLLHILQRGLQLVPFKVIKSAQYASLFMGAKTIESLLLGSISGWVTHRHRPFAHTTIFLVGVYQRTPTPTTSATSRAGAEGPATST